MSFCITIVSLNQKFMCIFWILKSCFKLLIAMHIYHLFLHFTAGFLRQHYPTNILFRRQLPEYSQETQVVSFLLYYAICKDLIKKSTTLFSYWSFMIFSLLSSILPSTKYLPFSLLIDNESRGHPSNLFDEALSII